LITLLRASPFFPSLC
jgi:hypothetical protein